MALTNYRDTDLEILLSLDDKSLLSTCRVNKYLASLCREDRLWKDKILLNFKGETDLLKYKPENFSWREWYFFWMTHRDDPLSDKLDLNPKQRMIRILTQKGEIHPGSEKFITLDLALKRAFHEKNNHLIDYFMKLIQQERQELPPSFYTSTIIAALKNKYHDKAMILIHLLSNEDTQPFLDIIEVMGRYNLIDLFNEIKMVSRSGKEYLYFEIGRLIEGRSKIPLSLLLSQLEGNYDFSELIRKLIQAGNYTTLKLIKDEISTDLIDTYNRILVEEEYYHNVDKEWFENNLNIDYFISKNPQLVLTLLKFSPDLRHKIKFLRYGTCYRPLLDYALQEGIAITLDFEKCSLEILERYFTRENYDKGLLSPFNDFSLIIKKGRYDLITLLPRLIENIQSFNKETMRGSLEVALKSSYKDIFLYLLIIYLENFVENNKGEEELFKLNSFPSPPDRCHPEIKLLLNALVNKEMEFLFVKDITKYFCN